jgi:hypothetical protein
VDWDSDARPDDNSASPGEEDEDWELPEEEL